MPSNYTITIEKNFELGSEPWVKLTLPECAQLEDGKQLQIFDQSSLSMITFQKYSQFDYVFELHQGINFFTLMNLKNPTEACLWQAQRLSFEYRSYEDA